MPTNTVRHPHAAILAGIENRRPGACGRLWQRNALGDFLVEGLRRWLELSSRRPAEAGEGERGQDEPAGGSVPE